MLRNTQRGEESLLVKAAEILGQNLRAIRKQLGLRQDDLAYGLGITAPSVSRWESGESLPDSESLDKLSRFLNLPVWKLFYSELSPNDVGGKSTPPPKREPSLAESIRVVNAHILGDIVIKKKSHK